MQVGVDPEVLKDAAVVIWLTMVTGSLEQAGARVTDQALSTSRTVWRRIADRRRQNNLEPVGSIEELEAELELLLAEQADAADEIARLRSARSTVDINTWHTTLGDHAVLHSPVFGPVIGGRRES